jgi:hypothetical protein
VTAYQLTPVGASGPEPDRAVVVDIPSRAELLLQNERLKEYLEAARVDVATYRQMWQAAHVERLKAEARSSRAAQVLASIGRLSPFAAALVERARVEIWRLDE